MLNQNRPNGFKLALAVATIISIVLLSLIYEISKLFYSWEPIRAAFEFSLVYRI